MEARISKVGNYIIIVDENNKQLFNAASGDTSFKIKGDIIMVYEKPSDGVSTETVSALTSEFKDENGGAISGGVVTWLRENTGFNTASGGSGAELTPDELAGIQNANGLSAANPAATMGDLPTDFGVQTVTGDGVDNTDTENPIINIKPLATADTATEITLYPFGNFCNSYSANLEDTFTFALTDSDNPAGESATVLIKTDLGATDFPVLTDAEYVEGAPFEADAYFDLYAWHNGATVAYTFLSRSAPPPDPTLLTIKTTSTSANWTPTNIVNDADTLIWNVTGSVIYTDIVQNKPTFNLTGNTGDVVITARNIKKLRVATFNSNMGIYEISIGKIDYTAFSKLGFENNIGITSIDLQTLINISKFDDINILNTGINGEDIDFVIITLDNYGFDGALYVNATRTSASDAAKAAIIGRGGTISEF